MRMSFGIVILGLSFFFNKGLMAEHTHHPKFQNWITIQDEESGLKADFPHPPVEMNIALPFHCKPPTGQLRFFSTPTSKGLLGLCTFFSPTFDAVELQQEQLLKFFETVLVPHFFVEPAVFKQHQTYHFQAIETNSEEKAASFTFTFKDKKIVKRIEGIAQVQDQTLCVAFYMASDDDFDQDVYTRFLNSIQFPLEQEE